MPLFFALLSFCLYMLLYRPSINSEDFVTALLVFFAALGWSAVIILTKEKKQTATYFYIMLCLGVPLGMALFFHQFNRLWHMMLIGLTALALLGLRFFVAGYFKYRKE